MEQAPAFMTNEAAAMQQPQPQGLLSQADSGTPTETDPMANEEGEPATPEEQAQYEKVLANAMNTIHGDSADKIIEKLSAEGKPEELIATVGVSLLIKLVESAEEAGKPIADTVLMAAGEDIINELVNIGVIGKLWGDIDEDEGESIQQEAWFIAVDKFGRYYEQTGKIDKDELRAGIADVQAGKYDNMDLGAV